MSLYEIPVGSDKAMQVRAFCISREKFRDILAKCSAVTAASTYSAICKQLIAEDIPIPFNGVLVQYAVHHRFYGTPMLEFMINKTTTGEFSIIKLVSEEPKNEPATL